MLTATTCTHEPRGELIGLPNRSRGLIGALAAAMLFVLAAPVSAQSEVRFDFDGEPGEGALPKPWTFNRWSPLFSFGSFEATAKVVSVEGDKVLYLRSADSGFLVGSKRQVDVARFRHVRWRWKAEALPTGASFRQRSTNDQALQLLFGFAGGKIVGYIWDSTDEPGATGSGLSWRDDVRVIVVRAGPEHLDEWLMERRNLYDDYVRLFGEAPPQMVGVAIQSNSQHTESAGAGFVGAITLTPEAPPPPAAPVASE
ncbi:MAG: DUF3047 domain-containing protein [Myxococcota bacterium]